MSDAQLARICWNSSGWQYPTGEAAKMEDRRSYVSKTGFGHEEWLFNYGWMLKGWQYGFLQPVNAARDRIAGDTKDLHLFSISPERDRLLVARISRAQVLTHEEAVAAVGEFEKRGWRDQMRRQVQAVGGKVGVLKRGKRAWWQLNIRFRPSDVEFYDPPLALPRGSKPWRSARCRLMTVDAPTSRAVRALERKRAGSTQRKKIKTGSRSWTSSARASPIHDHLQNHVLTLLKRKHPEAEVHLERDWVDVTMRHGRRLVFIEVKTAPRAIAAVQEALGQLLKYVHGAKRKRRPELVVMAPAPMDRPTTSFLDWLDQEHGIQVGYEQVTLETRRLAL